MIDLQSMPLNETVISGLRLPQRLALSYAPRTTRAGFAGLFAFDAALGDIIRQAREPVLAQLRLAWWRDALAKDVADRPNGNPVLGLLNAWGAETAALRDMVDGWEGLLDEGGLDEDAINRFATARADAFSALARLSGAGRIEEVAGAGKLWALADLRSGLSDIGERDLALGMAQRALPLPRTLPRAMRPLAVLAGLAHRALLRGNGVILSGKEDMVVAMRLGLFGR